MADLQTNILSSLAKVIESAQSGYAARGLPSRVPEQNQAATLRFTVLASDQKNITLQANTSKQTLVLEKAVIGGAQNLNIVAGDKIVMISKQNTQTYFYVNKDSGDASSTGQRDVSQFTKALAKQWQGLSANLVAKIPPKVLAQTQIANNTVQSKQMFESIVNIAQKAGQPSLGINVMAKISFLTASNTNSSPEQASFIRLNTRLPNHSVNIDIPAIPELREKLANNKSVNLQLNAQDSKGLVKAIFTKGTNKTQISQLGLKEINKAIADPKSPFSQGITTNLKSQLLSENSTALKNGIVIDGSKENLDKLAKPIRNALMQENTSATQSKLVQANSVFVKEGVSKLVPSDSAKLLVSQLQNSSQLMLSLIAKPQLLNIATSVLQAKLDSIQEVTSPLQNKNELSSTILNDSTKQNRAPTLSDSAHTDSSIKGASITESAVKQARLIQNTLIKEFLAQSSVNSPQDASKVTPSIGQVKTLITNYMNKLLPNMTELNKSLPELQATLLTMKESASPDTKALLQSFEQVLSKTGVIKSTETNLTGKISTSAHGMQNLSPALDAALAPQSAQAIKEDIISAALPALSQPTISQVVSQNSPNLVNALISMLQTSLYAKLISKQGNLLTKLNNTPEFLSFIAAFPQSKAQSERPAVRQNASRILQEFAQLDTKGKLISDIKNVLNTHSLQKLASVDASIQGQDSFFYSLNNGFSQSHNDTEIQISREKEDTPDGQNDNTQEIWKLNIKLDIGKLGKMLAKIKLESKSNKLDVNLYTSNPQLRDIALSYLPILNTKLTSYGFDVKQACYVGKIPKTLHKTDFQVVHAYA